MYSDEGRSGKLIEKWISEFTADRVTVYRNSPAKFMCEVCAESSPDGYLKQIAVDKWEHFQLTLDSGRLLGNEHTFVYRMGDEWALSAFCLWSLLFSEGRSVRVDPNIWEDVFSKIASMLRRLPKDVIFPNNGVMISKERCWNYSEGDEQLVGDVAPYDGTDAWVTVVPDKWYTLNVFGGPDLH